MFTRGVVFIKLVELQCTHKVKQNFLNTTNDCESFHAVLKSSFYHYHPQIFNFLEVLKDIQADTYIKICTARSGISGGGGGERETEMNDNYIQKMVKEYSEGRISRFQFVKAVAYKNKI
jgi:hypothetical protein